MVGPTFKFWTWEGADWFYGTACFFIGITWLLVIACLAVLIWG